MFFRLQTTPAAYRETQSNYNHKQGIIISYANVSHYDFDIKTSQCKLVILQKNIFKKTSLVDILPYRCAMHLGLNGSTRYKCKFSWVSAFGASLGNRRFSRLLGTNPKAPIPIYIADLCAYYFPEKMNTAKKRLSISHSGHLHWGNLWNRSLLIGIR